MQKKLMGVVNITPDSFSDGNIQLTEQDIMKQINEELAWADIVDIGAESTAPFNQAVSEQAELDRFKKYLFPILDQVKFKEISIDTYKVSVFKEVYQYLKKYETPVYFNDVSGCLDDELINFLGTHRRVRYIFSHNLAPRRAETSNHMNYLSKKNRDEFLKELVDYFEKGISVLEAANIPFLIDPCFGFSKTREQNHYLLSKFKTFLLQIPYDIPVVIGVSRKSFLRFPSDLNIKTPAGLSAVEQVHSNVLMHLFQSQLKREFIIRTHDIAPIKSALDTLNIFDK